MKKLLIASAFVTILALCATAVSAAVLSPGLDIISSEVNMTVSALEGEPVTFSADQFADAVGADGWESIEITALPQKSDGVLYFGDVGVTEGQVIKNSSVSRLRFEPAEKAQSASFGFTFNGAYAMVCNVVFTDKRNEAPTVIEGPELTAFTQSTAKGEMRAVDADGDGLFFEVVEYPEGGKLRFDSKTGEFTYTAGSRIMTDSFTYRVKDDLGNTSKICKMTMCVIENSNKTVFSDMEDSENTCAAVAMTEKGYMSTTKEKGKICFDPDESVSRLDFLVTAMNVFGADNVPDIENTGFSDDAEIPDEYKGYVYSAARLGIINGISENGALCFKPEKTVTKAEAAVILNNIIGYETTSVKSIEGVPEWASSAVCAMYELGVYDMEQGSAHCSKAVTRDGAAQMLYTVMCLLGE